MCHFKLLQLKQVSHKARLSQESHSAVCRKPVIRWWAAVTQSLINGEDLPSLQQSFFLGEKLQRLDSEK